LTVYKSAIETHLPASLDELAQQLHFHAHYPRTLVYTHAEGSDTVYLMPPRELELLTNQIVPQQNYFAQADSIMRTQQRIIENLRLNQSDLKATVEEKDNVIKSVRRRWLKITLYVGGGALAAGVVTGVIIAQ
jgi:hypothetical protein